MFIYIIGINNFKQILLTLVPEEPSIPSDICEELIVLALSIYHQNDKDEIKAQYIFYWLLCKYIFILLSLIYYYIIIFS